MSTVLRRTLWVLPAGGLAASVIAVLPVAAYGPLSSAGGEQTRRRSRSPRRTRAATSRC